MKPDLYTKIVLTVIAACLCLIVLERVELIPRAHAASPAPGLDVPRGYALVPVNPDGSIDVRITSMKEPLEVNIEEIDGYSVRSSAAYLPVKIR